MQLFWNPMSLWFCLLVFSHSGVVFFEFHGTMTGINCTQWQSKVRVWQGTFGTELTNDNSLPKIDCKQGTKCSEQHLKKKLSCSYVSPKEQMLLHANSKVMTVKLPCKMLHVWSNIPTRSTSSLARLLTRCACFVMVRCKCYHMPVGLHNIVTEHGMGT